MSNRKVTRALKKIAARDGVPIDTVRREIESALAAARENPARNAQAFWRQVSGNGGKPNAEEMIQQLANMTRRS